MPPPWQGWVRLALEPRFSLPVSTAFPLPGTAPLRFQHEGWSCRSTAASASLCLFSCAPVSAVGHCLFLERRPTWGFQWVPHEGTRLCNAHPSHTAQHFPWPSMTLGCWQIRRMRKWTWEPVLCSQHKSQRWVPILPLRAEQSWEPFHLRACFLISQVRGIPEKGSQKERQRPCW